MTAGPETTYAACDESTACHVAWRDRYDDPYWRAVAVEHALSAQHSDRPKAPPETVGPLLFLASSVRHSRLEDAMDSHDHRAIGNRLDLFHQQDDAPGMVFWHPKGATLYRILEEYIRVRMRGHGFSEVRTPQLLIRSPGNAAATSKNSATACSW